MAGGLLPERLGPQNLGLAIVVCGELVARRLPQFPGIRFQLPKNLVVGGVRFPAKQRFERAALSDGGVLPLLREVAPENVEIGFRNPLRPQPAPNGRDESIDSRLVLS